MLNRKKYIEKIIISALNEDLGEEGDITSIAIIDEDIDTNFEIVTNENIIFCGEEVINYIFSGMNFKLNYRDGDKLIKNNVIAYGKVNARYLLSVERVLLNIIQHLCGISTITNQFVEAVSSTKAKILDTRKTIPNFRVLQKYAVQIGGGQNHRMGLYDMIMIKDNHIAIAGNISNAVSMAKIKFPDKKIEIECDTIEQVKETMTTEADIILLDNMSIEQIQESVKIINKTKLIEVSGGVNISNILPIAKANVDFISVGALTHSVKAADISLNITK